MVREVYFIMSILPQVLERKKKVQITDFLQVFIMWYLIHTSCLLVSGGSPVADWEMARGRGYSPFSGTLLC